MQAGLGIVFAVAEMLIAAPSGDPLMHKSNRRTVTRCEATFWLPDNWLQRIALRNYLPVVANRVGPGFSAVLVRSGQAALPMSAS